jgi:molybdopterin converting factor small subunit
MSGGEVLVRYWAAAKAAAGMPEERFDVVATLADLLDAVRARHDDGRLADVLQRCSYLVDEVSPGAGRDPGDVPLAAGAVVDVLPPFAGGSGLDRRPSGTSERARRLGLA